eukprot:CAMPEP_0170566254 /NCGR_PEP_ID=MMETSP0211-20121228/79715_1 /TAXON_ID=311385 /ORGANISM="Pseudokeronopsis sp., Strain OXSARD2" /LENGTH=69 /DNA_ID=CAMNT_0010887361 /DNA_START=479 /DNA_END=685 /DNA_ORIENTATION=-
MAIMCVTNASLFGPDLGEANACANRIFDILDSETPINPLIYSENPTNYKEMKEFGESKIQGRIEFKNVW